MSSGDIFLNAEPPNHLDVLSHADSERSGGWWGHRFGTGWVVAVCGLKTGSRIVPAVGLLWVMYGSALYLPRP